ncbi:MAG: hypothetical protein K6F92_00255 [Lachnospiraceae bacterium]|nr:hypothetical protein [Lachnospiraceae bacterium]
MTELLVIREHLKKLYAAHSRLIDVCARAFLMILTMVAVDSYIGAFHGFTHVLIIIIVGAVAAFLPASVSAGFISVYIALDLAGISIELAAVFAFMIMLFLLLYFIFKPGNSYVMTISILLGVLQFYGPVPMIIGLLMSPLAAFPMLFGIVSSRLILYVSDNFVLLSSKTSSLSAIEKVLQVINGVFLNSENISMMITLVFVVLLVYIIRKLPVKHSWEIAVTGGVFMYLLVSLMCDYALDLNTSIAVLIVNVILEIITGVTIVIMYHMVDYSREENVQFEDDDYYYYVKAIPKITVSVPDIKVTRIKERSVKEVNKDAENVIFATNEETMDDEADDETPQAEEAEVKDTEEHNDAEGET